MSTRFETEPTARTTCFAVSSCIWSSWLIVTTPGLVMRPSPRYAVAPAFSSAVTWPVSSGSSASAERLTM